MKTLFLLTFSLLLAAQDKNGWPQFRGPNASGVADRGPALPVEFGARKNLLWKRALPSGHSSPVVWGDRIFVTGYDKQNNKLELLCLARKNGEIIWTQAVPAAQIEKVHPVNSVVTATPVVNGNRVYAYFGSYGLVAYDLDGKQQWSAPLPMPKTKYGSGTSPVVAGDLLILNRDAQSDGYLLAVDRESGKTVWQKSYPPSMGGDESQSTPVLWKDQLVLHRSGRVEGYDLKDGKLRWWLNVQTSGASTATVDQDTVYVATWTSLGESDQLVPIPDFATMIEKYDANGDGQISQSEFPKDLAVIRRPDTPNVEGATVYLAKFFKMLDSNNDGAIQQKEWEAFVQGFSAFKTTHGVLAIRPTGDGDVKTAVAWKESTAIPEIPTPLLYDGRLYLVRNGGIVTCLNAQTGKVLFRERLGAGGPYYSSPIAANGKIYASSGDGTVVVFSAGGKLEVLAKNDLQEEIFATPAVAGGALYVRTAKQLFAFAGK